MVHFGYSKKPAGLRIFNLNAWAASYFNDEPYPSLSEPFDVATVKETYLQVVVTTYRVLISILLLIYLVYECYLSQSTFAVGSWRSGRSVVDRIPEPFSQEKGKAGSSL